jgi:hypothetical protein
MQLTIHDPILRVDGLAGAVQQRTEKRQLPTGGFRFGQASPESISSSDLTPNGDKPAVRAVPGWLLLLDQRTSLGAVGGFWF